MRTHESRFWTAVATGKRDIMKALSAACLISLSGLMLGTGCDTDSATSAVSISPSSATMEVGQSREFVASGGYTYTWSLQDNAIGTLSSRTGDRVTYTALSAPSNGTQVITVTSTIPGSSSGSTSTGSSTTNTVTTAAYQVTAEAIVNFK